MSKQIKLISGVIILLLLIFGVFKLTNSDSFSDKNGKQPEGETVEIGAPLPLSGQLAYKGEQGRNGLLLAQEEINKSGGINGRPLKFIIENNQGKPAKAATAAQKLFTTDNVPIIISKFTSLSSTIAPIAEDKNKILIYQSTVSSLAESNKNVFKDYYNMTEVGSSFVDIASNQNLDSMAVLYPKSDWGDEFNQGITSQSDKEGLQTNTFEFNPDTQDLQTVVLKAKNSGANSVAIAAFPGQTVRLLKSMKENNWLTPKVLGLELLNESISSDPTVKQVLRETNAISSWFDFDPDNAQGEASSFVKNYKNKFAQKPSADAAYFYDEAYVIKNVLSWCEENDAINTDCLKQRLKEMPTYVGVGGTVNFNHNGVSNRPLKFYQFKEDGWKTYSYDE